MKEWLLNASLQGIDLFPSRAHGLLWFEHSLAKVHESLKFTNMTKTQLFFVPR